MAHFLYKMQEITEIIFFMCIIVIGYTYIGYFLYLLCLYKIKGKKQIKKKAITPKVSVIIAVYNEEKNIGKKIKNLLKQTYPKNKLEIIFISDGSTDNTNNILLKAEQEHTFIKAIIYKKKRSKPYALNLGVQHSQGEIIIFADARQEFDHNAISNLVKNFADKSVGCVSGELVFVENTDSKIKAEIGTYWKFEKYIRYLESLTGSVVGATGAIYAIKKELFVPFPEDILLDDVYLPLKIAEQTYRVLFDSEALAFDVYSPDFSKEKRRKIRTLLGNWQLIYKNPSLIIPYKHPLWFRFISHKFLRLIIPHVFLLTVFTAAFSGYLWVTMLIFIAMILSFLRTNIPILRKILSLNRSFFFLNYCALLAFFYFLRKKWDIW